MNLVSHLFDVKNVPPSGFAPPKYVKKYEKLVDTELQNICEDYLNLDSRYRFVLFTDLNCHATTHNKIFSKDWTGVHEKDFVNNRIKRFFDSSEVLLRASRVGIKNLEKIPARSNRDVFLKFHGSLLKTESNSNEYLVQTYTRDTGEVMSVLSMPTYVQGERVGVVLFGWEDTK
jgi:methyl-accepting chemotaxis protein